MTEYLTIYTDGACKGNPGPGGWGFAIQRDGGRWDTWSGELENTTNNIAELHAVYHALLEVPAHSCVLFITDSKLVVGWLNQGWRRNKEHIDEPCKAIEDVKHAKNIRWAFRRVKGHADNEGNNIADRLASQAALSAKHRLR